MEGHTNGYDIGLFNNRFFSYVASFGFGCSLAYGTSQKMKNKLGHAAYVIDGAVLKLPQLLKELKPMHLKMEYDGGFIEDDFYFGAISNSTSVAGTFKYDPDDMPQALNQAAETLVKACANDSFAVSFACENTDLVIPEGRTRLFLTGVVAADAAAMADKTSFADKATHVGFLTDLHDTRFDNYCVLRPIIAAQE
jgi:hypothetical protein